MPIFVTHRFCEKRRFDLHFRSKWLLFALFLGKIVAPANGQCVLACSQNLQLSLDQMGQALITVPLIAPSSPALCPGQIDLTVFNPAGQPIAPLVGCAWVNQTLAVKLQHVATGQIGWGSVVVKDWLPPVISSVEKFIFCTEPTAPASIGWPTVSDNCTAMNQANLTFSDVETDLACGTFEGGQAVTARIDRTWRATDGQGNQGVSTQKIWLKRATLADVAFPLNRDGLEAPTLNCSQNPLDLALTGVPTVAGFPINNNGACDLAISSTEQTYPICGPVSRRILRTWQVVDWCINQFALDVQIIKTIDNTSPALVLPQNLTVFVPSGECTATVNLPQPTASDDCSGATLTASWPFGSGFGPFQKVPVGQHAATLTATDGCGNSSTGQILVTVADQIPPSPICKSGLTISLNNDGMASLAAPVFDGGSYDNCLISSRLVSRDGGLNYAAIVPFSCADVLPAPVLVRLKIIDAAGNFEVCEAPILVKDHAPPLLANCPADLILACWDDFENLNLTGQPTATDACGPPILTFLDVKSLNSCYVGSINRTWKATDQSGNTATCLQKITLQKQPQTLSIAWPKDSVFTACPGPLTPQIGGSPVFSGNTCAGPTTTFSDTIFSPPSPNFCFKIKRHWRVVDPCTFDPTTGSTVGEWLHDQILVVTDGQPPVFDSLADTVFQSPNFCPQPFAVSLPDVAVSDCSPFFSVSNNSPFASISGRNASGIYPPGLHVVVFSAVDGCGNSATKSMKIEVKCPLPALVSIGGSVRTETGLPVKNIRLTAETDGFQRKTWTNEAGQFEADSLPLGATFIVKAKNRSNWLNGVSTFDLVGMRKHILAVKLLDSPFKIIAGDINRNNSLTTFDLVELRKLILGVYDSLPSNDSWRFIDSSYVFQNPKWPFGEPFSEKITLSALQSNAVGQRFVGIKIGDVNGSVNPQDVQLRNADSGFRNADFEFRIGSPAERGGEAVWPVFIENAAMQPGFSGKIAVRAADLARLDGFQFSLNFDSEKLKLNGISSPGGGLRDEHFNQKQVADGRLTVSFDGGPNGWLAADSLLFELDFTCLRAMNLADALRFDDAYLPGEAYENDLILTPEIHFLETKTDGQFGLLPNQPNPFRDKTTVPFWLPVSTEATLILSDATGRVLNQVSKNWSPGRHEIEILGDELPDSGVYFMRLFTPDGPVSMQKLVFLK